MPVLIRISFSRNIADLRIPVVFGQHILIRIHIHGMAAYLEILVAYPRIMRLLNLPVHRFGGACATTDQLILSVTHNQGKIGTMEDGFLFYYMPIAAHQSFVLQATATILQLNPQIEQVAFGLMVRDELLIDTACQYPLGDYVATGYLHTPVCAFGRKNTKFISGAPSTHVVNQIGDSVSLTITATQEGYSLQYGDNLVQSAGFDYALTRIDHDYVYAGMFVSRNATVAFSNVHTQFI